MSGMQEKKQQQDKWSFFMREWGERERSGTDGGVEDA